MPMFSQHLDNQVAGRAAPGIPVQALVKSGPAGLDKLSIALLVVVKPGDGLGIGSSPGSDRQQKAVLTVSDHLRYATGAGRNRGQSESIGLAEHQPEALVSR